VVATSTVNISLPDTLQSFVDEQVGRRGVGTRRGQLREPRRRARRTGPNRQ
jgi:hypothetical protein